MTHTNQPAAFNGDSQHTMMEGRLKRMAVFPAKLDQNRTNSVSGAVKVRTMVMMFLLVLIECLNTSTNARASRLWCFLLADAEPRQGNESQQTRNGAELFLRDKEEGSGVAKQSDDGSDSSRAWRIAGRGPRIGSSGEAANLDGNDRREVQAKWVVVHVGEPGRLLKSINDGPFPFDYMRCPVLDEDCVRLVLDVMKCYPQGVNLALQMKDEAMRDFFIDRRHFPQPKVYFIGCMTPPLVFDEEDSLCRGGAATFDPRIQLEHYTEFLPIFELRRKDKKVVGRCSGASDFSIPQDVDVFTLGERLLPLTESRSLRARIEGFKIVGPVDKENFRGKTFFSSLVLKQREGETQITTFQCDGHEYQHNFQNDGPVELDIESRVKLTLPYKREKVVNRHEIRLYHRRHPEEKHSYKSGLGGDRIFCSNGGDLDDGWVTSCASMVYHGGKAGQERFVKNELTDTYILASNNEMTIGKLLTSFHESERRYGESSATTAERVRERFHVLLVIEESDPLSPANRDGHASMRWRTSSLSVWESFYPVDIGGWELIISMRDVIQVKACYGPFDLEFETRNWELRFVSENAEAQNKLSKPAENLTVKIHFTLRKIDLTIVAATGEEKHFHFQNQVLQHLILRNHQDNPELDTLKVACNGKQSLLRNSPLMVEFMYLQLQAKTNHKNFIRTEAGSTKSDLLKIMSNSSAKTKKETTEALI